MDHHNSYSLNVYHPTPYELEAAQRRCVNSDIRADMKALPPIEKNEAISCSIQSHAIHMYTRKLKSFYDNFFQMAACFNIVDFLVDCDLCIYNCGGEAQLLAGLKEINFCVGANLSENRAGYNAVSLCRALFGKSFLKNTSVFLNAGESYADILKPYVFLAIETRSYVGAYGTGFHLLAVKKEHLNEKHLFLFANFAQNFNECLIAKAYNIPPLEFTKALYNYRNTIQIFTDGDGYITLVNDRFERLMNTDTPKIGGHLISDVIPGLRAALYSVRAGKNVYMQNIQMQNASGENEAYYMDAVGISSGDKITDILFTMQEVKAEKRRAGRLVSDGAFFSFHDIIGDRNPEFRRIKELATRIALGSSNVLIAGESGTGKELFAQSIHQASPRCSQPFVSINCAAIPKELISSELFGYDEGAFTGAKKTGSPGKFEIADGGTLFLDEIGEMPLDMQSVLLRVIEEQRITRLGSSKSRKIDVRIIAASNRNLLECVNNRTFRADLYYRINVLQLNLPPLRKRKEDIPQLAEHFLHQLSATSNPAVTEISKEAMEMLIAYDWPGNIRELRNIIERAINVCDGTVISPCDIMFTGSSGAGPASAAADGEYSVSSLNRKFDDFEFERIKSLIIKYNNNKTLVAKELGISRRTLYNKLKKAQSLGVDVVGDGSKK